MVAEGKHKARQGAACPPVGAEVKVVYRTKKPKKGKVIYEGGGPAFPVRICRSYKIGPCKGTPALRSMKEAKEMKRTRMEGIPAALPPALLPLATGVAVYDSSSSREAQVYLIDRDGGYYLKIAQKGALAREAQMAAYFHKKGLGPAVAAYISEESDFLLTARLAGEDATHARYLSDPRRLCDRMAEELRALHELSCADCPVTNRTADYLALAERNYRAGRHDPSLFPDGCGYRSAEEAYTVLQEGKGALRCEVLLHGDYCLPNILFDGWRLSGFVDVGCGGVGDRHIDLFWGAWTLRFNLKTDRYRDRFFDAYGRDCVDGALLRTVAAAELFG